MLPLVHPLASDTASSILKTAVAPVKTSLLDSQSLGGSLDISGPSLVLPVAVSRQAVPAPAISSLPAAIDVN